MSPYLHFGQVSPVTLALLAQEHGGNGTKAFLEELIVRWELALNFVRYNDHYDSFASLPAWAQKTLALHQADQREYGYFLDELERAATHDPYWNAAQQEMMKTDKMQGYMRCTGARRSSNGVKHHKDAYSAPCISIINMRLTDGIPTDSTWLPGALANTIACGGERPIFGMVRHMNAQGLKRKFSMDGYIEKVRLVR